MPTSKKKQKLLLSIKANKFHLPILRSRTHKSKCYRSSCHPGKCDTSILGEDVRLTYNEFLCPVLPKIIVKCWSSFKRFCLQGDYEFHLVYYVIKEEFFP